MTHTKYKKRMLEESVGINDVLRKVCQKYLYSVMVIFILFSLYYHYTGMRPLAVLSGMYAIMQIPFFIILYKFNYNIIKRFISIYLVLISIALLPYIIFYWQFSQITAFLWYLLIPLASLLFFSIRITFFWCIYIIVMICFAFILTLPFGGYYSPSLSKTQVEVLNIMTISGCLYLFFFFLYYLNKINQMKAWGLLEQESFRIIDIQEREDVIDNKYNKVYKAIVHYFEKNEPYCDPDFTISMLATKINSNVTYISKAIKKNRNMSFNLFVNTYRIDMVKTMFDNDYHNKYTMMYIYLKSGFKHQSTFNKVFKQIEGTTPSEYIKKRY